MTVDKAHSSPPSQSDQPAPEHEPLPLGILIGMTTLCAAVLVSAVVWAGVRLWPEKQYPTDTPQALVATAGEMIRDRRADRLVELIEPAPPEEQGTEHERRMSDLLIRLGRVFDAAQGLHRSVQAEMPEELEQLSEEFARAEARGERTGLLASLMPGRGRSGGPDRDEARQRAISRLLADPFAGLDDAINEQIDRIGFQEVGADTAAVTWDGRAVLPPFGLIVREREDGWRVVPPTSLPMVRRVMPDSDAEYQVWGSLLATLESLLDDLQRDVASGRIGSIDELRQRAIEDAMIPMGMIMAALGNADDDG